MTYRLIYSMLHRSWYLDDGLYRRSWNYGAMRSKRIKVSSEKEIVEAFRNTGIQLGIEDALIIVRE